MWTLNNLIKHCGEAACKTKDGKWVSLRPERGPLIWRIRAAYMVLIGKADAFTWPGDQ